MPTMSDELYSVSFISFIPSILGFLLYKSEELPGAPLLINLLHIANLGISKFAICSHGFSPLIINYNKTVLWVFSKKIKIWVVVGGVDLVIMFNSKTSG